MASTLAVASSFLGPARPSPAVNRRGLVVAKAAAGPRQASVSREPEQDGSGRRGVMLAAAAAAICAAGSVQWAAVAEEEPKRGTPEAKKKYAPVCVTMPTASICHK